LEAELSDPLNPALHIDDDKGSKLDTGELMRGVVEVRGRLEKVRRGKETRGKLVETILNRESNEPSQARASDGGDAGDSKPNEAKEDGSGTLTTLDRRVGELEELLGSSSIALDDVCIKI
jgi:nuclear migration protein JNM1